MVHITIGANESFDAALRRFNKKVQQEGIITETRRRKAYDKPSVLRKKKEATKRRKARASGPEGGRSRGPRTLADPRPNPAWR